jgi:P27 family predicted phage terminase small subunit
MGKRGPQPRPTKLKVISGERKDRVNDDEPVPPAGEVEPPGWLSAEALEVWKEYSPKLAAMQVLTTVDVEALARWCDAVIRRRQAAAKIDVEGAVLHEPITAGGEVVGQRAKKNPWVQVWKDADQQVAAIGARFGLTPSERSQLKVGTDGTPGSTKQGAGRLLS